MSQFPSLPDDHQLADVFKRFPQSVGPLLAYHDRVLRDWSPLTVGERELIAAYVSALNACTYCHGSHQLAAEAFGIDASLLETLLQDPDSANIDRKLKPLLAYVAKLTRTPARMTAADAHAVYAVGWDEDALFSAVSVCGLFNLMNRIVEGTGTRHNPLTDPIADREARKQRLAGEGAESDSHYAQRSYTGLATLWGIADA